MKARVCTNVKSGEAVAYENGERRRITDCDKTGIRIAVPDTEEMMRAVDVIEANIANYIQNYRGDSNVSASVKMLHDVYFQAEDYYANTDAKTSENVDKAFWANIVQIGTPAMVDDERGPCRRKILL